MKFFKCPDCGTVLIPDRSEDFAPKKLVELVPNTTDAAGEKHVPVITVDGSCVRVAVGTVEHPMLEAHSITFIVLETSQGYQKKDLKPGEKPEACLHIPRDPGGPFSADGLRGKLLLLCDDAEKRGGEPQCGLVHF